MLNAPDSFIVCKVRARVTESKSRVSMMKEPEIFEVASEAALVVASGSDVSMVKRPDSATFPA